MSVRAVRFTFRATFTIDVNKDDLTEWFRKWEGDCFPTAQPTAERSYAVHIEREMKPVIEGDDTDFVCEMDRVGFSNVIRGERSEYKP